MKRRSTSILCLILVVLTLASFFCVSAAANREVAPPKVENATAACLYDKTHNKMLVNENPDLVVNTSTSAKVMMGLIACEMHLESILFSPSQLLHSHSGPITSKLLLCPLHKLPSFHSSTYLLQSILCPAASKTFKKKKTNKTMQHCTVRNQPTISYHT